MEIIDSVRKWKCRPAAEREDSMEDKIKSVIRDLFENAPDTQEIKELQEEMISNAEEKYEDLIQRGFTEEQAYTMVMASIGDVQEMLAELGAQASGEKSEKAKTDEKDEFWEKQGEYWKWQGEYFEKQAKNFGQQAKEAINSFMESDLFDNISSSIKQIIGGIGSSISFEFETDSEKCSNMQICNERKFAPEGITSLIVEVQNSPVDVDVQLTAEDEILVQEFYNKEPKEDQKLQYNLNGSQLKLEYSTNVIGFQRRGSIRIFLPESFAGSLEEFRVMTASGDVTMEDIGAARQTIKTMSGDVKGACAMGDVNVTTASGDISFELIEGKGSIHSASGDIKVKKAVGTMNQGTASGDIEIEELEGDGTFHTASGDVEITLTKAGEKLDIGTASGDVKVTLPAGCSVQMTLNSISGDIDTFCEGYAGEEHVDYVRNGKHAVGTVGEEPFLQLKASTASGDIDIKRNK